MVSCKLEGSAVQVKHFVSGCDQPNAAYQCVHIVRNLASDLNWKQGGMSDRSRTYLLAAISIVSRCTEQEYKREET